MNQHTGRLALLLLLALATPVLAQERDSTQADSAVVELPELEVVGSIAPTAGPTIGSGVPARFSTVSAEEIEAWEHRLLADALSAQAGVSSYDDLGTPYKLNLSSRGFTVGPTVGLPSGISVFLDGVRQNEPTAAEVNFDLLPMEHIRRIELLSGAGSLLGPNSLGGAVNLVSNRGGGPLRGELEVAAGTYESYSGEAAVSGTLGNRAGFYLGGGYGEEKGWRAATSAENYNGFLNLGSLGTERGIRLQAFGSKSRAETAGSLPESLYGSPRRNFTAGDFENLDLVQVALSGFAPLASGRGGATVYYRRSNGERFNVQQAPDDNVRSFTRNRTVGTNLDWRWARPSARGGFALRLGVDAAVNRVNVKLFEEDPADPSDAELETDADSPSWDVAGYAVGDYRVGRVTFTGGLRYDHIRIPFENNLDPTADTTNTFKRLSPRGGVSVAVGSAGSIYASVGQAFRAPAILELACADETATCPLPFALGDDPPLDPVVATTYEIGGQWVTGPARLTASAFLTDVKDDIFFIQSEAALFEGFFDNIGDTRREGIELGAQFFLRGGHSLYANYAYTRGTFRSNAEIFSIRADDDFAGSPLAGENEVEVGDELPLIPKHQVRVGGTVELPAGFELGLDGRLVGKQWFRGDEANETEPLDSYFTGNARLAWELGPWGVSAIVTNVFNSKKPIFGTFNENRLNGQLERFLTPMQGRGLKVVFQRGFGARGDD